MRVVNCDQVAWAINALERLTETHRNVASYPSCSHMRQAAITACMFELIEALDLVFEDDSARKNAIVIRGHKTAEEINETQNKVRG